MKAALLLSLLAVVFRTGALAGREILQATGPALPVLPLSFPDLRDVEALAAGPAASPFGPSASGSCALQYLQSAGNFQSLIDLVDASDESSLLTQILESPDVRATLLAPTDTGVQSTLKKLGYTVAEVTSNPLLVTELLTYHILPSQIQASDLKDSYSFNTELVTADGVNTVTIKGNGASATFVGTESSAAVAGSFVTACQIVVVPIDGILFPGFQAESGGA